MLVAIKKYKFHITKTKFYRFIIKLGKLSIDSKKIKAIVNWQELNNITKLRLFLGFYNYYQRFIAIQLKNIKPFTRLTKKNKLQKWQKEQRKLFKELKELFTAELILKIYTLSLPTVVNIDILDFALSIYLVQKHLDRQHLVIYYSYKITPLELNYNIYNKELLGIIAALKK